ncbi:MAG: hypothetical protein WD712_02225 [Candidatus Spechtbacterales bacterium]
MFFRKNWPYFALAFILFIGLFFRIHNLEETIIETDNGGLYVSWQAPPGIYPDEAKNANDAIETLQTGEYKIFYPENNGREGLWIWLIALSFKYFGISVFSLKLVSAVAGTLAILGTYLLTKEFLRFQHQYHITGELEAARVAAETISLFAAGAMATSFWHINFSRISFRAIMVPLLLSFGLYFTLRAIRTKNLFDSLIAGAIWGIGLYTYIAFRIAPAIPIFLVLFSFGVYVWHSRPNLSVQWLKKAVITSGWWKIFAMALSFIVTALPLVLTFIRNPDTFVSRSGGISVFNTDNFLFEFLKSLGAHLQMLVFVGDLNWRHNFSGQPELVLPVGILFLLGLICSANYLISGWQKKHWATLTVHLTLLVSCGIMILPAALTVEGIPHALRAIGLMPFVFIYAGLGLLFLVKIIFPHKRHRSEIWFYVLGAMMVIILLLASYQYTNYFVNWSRNTEVEGAFNKRDVKIGQYFNEIPDKLDKYLIVNRGGVAVSYPGALMPETNKEGLLPMSAQTVLFIQQIKNVPPQNTKYIKPEEIPDNIGNASVFIPIEADEETKETLRRMYPGGIGVEFEYFWAYHVIF